MAAETGQSPRPLDLAIIGGGISGVTLAIALYKRGVSCTVYEAASELTGICGAVPISCNALRAMEQVDRCVLGAYNLASTRNQSASKRNVWCDFVDGMSPQPATHLEPLFSIMGAENIGHTVVSCTRFLDELVRLLPRDMVRFDKELKHVLDDRIGSGKSKQCAGYVVVLCHLERPFALCRECSVVFCTRNSDRRCTMLNIPSSMEWIVLIKVSQCS